MLLLLLVDGAVGKQVGLRLVEVPGTHYVASEICSANVYPGIGVAYFVDPGLGRDRLYAGTTTPCGDRAQIPLDIQGLIDPRIVSRIVSERRG